MRMTVILRLTPQNRLLSLFLVKKTTICKSNYYILLVPPRYKYFVWRKPQLYPYYSNFLRPIKTLLFLELKKYSKSNYNVWFFCGEREYIKAPISLSFLILSSAKELSFPSLSSAVPYIALFPNKCSYTTFCFFTHKPRTGWLYGTQQWPVSSLKEQSFL